MKTHNYPQAKYAAKVIPFLLLMAAFLGVSAAQSEGRGEGYVIGSILARELDGISGCPPEVATALSGHDNFCWTLEVEMGMHKTLIDMAMRNYNDIRFTTPWAAEEGVLGRLFRVDGLDKDFAVIVFQVGRYRSTAWIEEVPEKR